MVVHRSHWLRTLLMRLSTGRCGRSAGRVSLRHGVIEDVGRYLDLLQRILDNPGGDMAALVDLAQAAGGQFVGVCAGIAIVSGAALKWAEFIRSGREKPR